MAICPLIVEDSGRQHYVGAVVAALYVGRAIGFKFWTSAVVSFGFRPVLLASLLLEAVFTLPVGLITNISVFAILRIAAGCCSALAPLTVLLMWRLQETFRGSEALAGSVLSVIITVGVIAGYGTGAILTITLLRFPYFWPWTVTSFGLFSAAAWLWISFPLILFHGEVRAKPAAQKQYAELTEVTTVHTEVQKADGQGECNGTERVQKASDQERKGEEAESVPGYLECFELEDIEVPRSSDEANTHRPQIHHTPISSPRVPFTSRPAPDSHRPLPTFSTPSIPTVPAKKTTISLVDDEFMQSISNQQSRTLDDPFRRVSGTESIEFWVADGLLAVYSMIFAYGELIVVMWLRWQCELSENYIAAVLAVSVTGVWAGNAVFGVLAERFALTNVVLVHCALLTAASVVALVGIHLRPAVFLSPLLYALLGRYFSAIITPALLLFVSDSVAASSRLEALMTSERHATVLKACGYIGAGLSFHLLNHCEYSLLILTIMLVAGGAGVAGSCRLFPRLAVSPYRV